MARRRLALVESFSEISDPRIERTKRHLLSDILTLAVSAVIAGAEGWEDTEEVGHGKHEGLKQYLSLENGIPSNDTISRAALGLIKQDKSKGSVKKKRKRAGWNNDALLTIVQNAV